MKRLILILFLILSMWFTFAATPTKTCTKDKKTKKMICKVVNSTSKPTVKIDPDLAKYKDFSNNINTYISKIDNYIDVNQTDTSTWYRTLLKSYLNYTADAIGYYSKNKALDIKYKWNFDSKLNKSIVKTNNNFIILWINLYNIDTGSKSIWTWVDTLIALNYQLSSSLPVLDCEASKARGLSLLWINWCNNLSYNECKNILIGQPYKWMSSFSFYIANNMACNKYELSIDSSNSSLYTYETDSYIENISIIDWSIYDISTIYK